MAASCGFEPRHRHQKSPGSERSRGISGVVWETFKYASEAGGRCERAARGSPLGGFEPRHRHQIPAALRAAGFWCRACGAKRSASLKFARGDTQSPLALTPCTLRPVCISVVQMRRRSGRSFFQNMGGLLFGGYAPHEQLPERQRIQIAGGCETDRRRAD